VINNDKAETVITSFQPNTEQAQLIDRLIRTTPADSDATDLLLKLHPVSYFLKQPSDFSQARQQFGYIAEEVEAIDDRLVTYQSDGQIRSVLYIHLIPILNKGFNELEGRVRTLEQDVARLKTIIAGLQKAALPVPK